MSVVRYWDVKFKFYDHHGNHIKDMSVRAKGATGTDAIKAVKAIYGSGARSRASYVNRSTFRHLVASDFSAKKALAMYTDVKEDNRDEYLIWFRVAYPTGGYDMYGKPELKIDDNRKGKAVRVRANNSADARAIFTEQLHRISTKARIEKIIIQKAKKKEK